MTLAIADRPDYDSLPLCSKSSFEYVVGTRADGRGLAIPIEIVVGQCRSPRLVAIAGVHGDEADGMAALQEVWQEIGSAQMRGTLIVVPVANPPAFCANQRCSPDDGLDLNRIFPGKLHGSETECLAYHLFHDVVLVADVLATFHGWGHEGQSIAYTEFAAGIGDPDVEAASLRAARAFGWDVLRVSPYKAGRLLPEATRAGIPTIESEIGGLGVSEESNRCRYDQALYRLMRHLGMWLEKKLDSSNQSAVLVRALEIKSPVQGFLRQRVALGAWVDEGEVLATVHDLHGLMVDELRAPTRALVGTQRRRPAVGAGDAVCTLFVRLTEQLGSLKAERSGFDG